MDTPPVWGKRTERPLLRPLLSVSKSQQLQRQGIHQDAGNTLSSLKIPLPDTLPQSSAAAGTETVHDGATTTKTPGRVRAKTAEPAQPMTPPASLLVKRAMTPGLRQQQQQQRSTTTQCTEQRQQQPQDDWSTQPWQATTLPPSTCSTPAPAFKEPLASTAMSAPPATALTPVPGKRPKRRENPETVVFNEMRSLRDENTRLQTALAMAQEDKEQGCKTERALQGSLADLMGDRARLQEQVQAATRQQVQQQQSLQAIKTKVAGMAATWHGHGDALQGLQAELMRCKQVTEALRDEAATQRGEADHARQALLQTQQQHAHGTQKQLQYSEQVRDQLAAFETLQATHAQQTQMFEDARTTIETLRAQVTDLLQAQATQAEQHAAQLARKDAQCFKADEMMLALAAVQEAQAAQAAQFAEEGARVDKTATVTTQLMEMQAQLSALQVTHAADLAAQRDKYETALSKPQAEMTALQERIEKLVSEQDKRLEEEKQAWQAAKEVLVMHLENELKQTQTTVSKLETSLSAKEALLQSKAYAMMELENLAKQQETRLTQLEQVRAKRDKLDKPRRASQDKTRPDREGVVPETQEISSDHVKMQQVYAFDEGEHEHRPRRLGYKRRK